MAESALEIWQMSCFFESFVWNGYVRKESEKLNEK